MEQIFSSDFVRSELEQGFIRSELEQRVTEILSQLEEIYGITIIYAVDAGSRAYGLHTPVSDHDIRVVYVFNDITKYITPEDSDECFVYFTEDKFIDVNAWNITKAMRHMRESNPSILEWLESQIVYRNKLNKYGITFRDACKNITKDMHSHLSLMYHYFNMAKQNWNDWIKDKSEVICKKYLYVIRPLVSLIFVMTKYENNPTEPLNLQLDFVMLLEDVKHLMTKNIYDVILELVEVKKGLLDKTEKISPIVELNNWIEQTFDHFELLTKREKKDTSDNEVDMKIDSLIKTYNKLSSETKTVIDITRINNATARSNYLNAIGTALQLLWLEQHKNDTMKMPEQIHNLLKDVVLTETVITEIRNVIDVLNEEDRIPDTNITMQDVYHTFVIPGLELISKDMGFDVLDLFDKKRKELIICPLRKDYAEFALRSHLELLWLLCNTEQVQSSRPKDIINIGDVTGTIPKEISLKIKKTVAELRPRYIVSENEVLNEWLRELVTEFKPKVDETRRKLAEIRQINAQKRLNYSVKNVDKQRFKDLVNSFVLQNNNEKSLI